MFSIAASLQTPAIRGLGVRLTKRATRSVLAEDMADRDDAPPSGRCETVEPELFLRERLTVAIHANPTRLKDPDLIMLSEGIAQHPMLQRLDDTAKADVVLWNVWGDPDTEANDTCPRGARATVLLIDWADGPEVTPYLEPSSYAMVFKRSFVLKEDGVFLSIAAACGSNCFPLAYGVMDQHLDGLNLSSIGDRGARPLSLVCSLRPWLMGADPHDQAREGLVRYVASARNRALYWLYRLGEQLPRDAHIGGTEGGFGDGIVSLAALGARENEKSTVAGQVRAGSTINDGYAQLLHTSFVAVEVNPRPSSVGAFGCGQRGAFGHGVHTAALRPARGGSLRHF